MKQCGNCGSMVADNAMYCGVCGVMLGENQAAEQEQNVQQYQNKQQPEIVQHQNQQLRNRQQPEAEQQWQTMQYQQSQELQQYRNQQQQYMNQQLVEQQRMINTMLEQQQHMQQKLTQNQPQQYIYVPTKVKTELSIRNGFAIVAAIVCLISLFSGILLDTSIIDIGSACGKLVEYAEGGEKATLIMVMLMPWIVGGLAVTLLISAFTPALNVLKEILEGVHLICFLCLFGVIVELFPHIEFGDFEMGFWILIVGFVMAMISNHTDLGPKDTSVYAPRRVIGNGVSDANARSVADMAQDGKNAAWICPKCDTRNTGAVCKVCGTTKK